MSNAIRRSASIASVPRGTVSTTPTSQLEHWIIGEDPPASVALIHGAPHAVADVLCEPMYTHPYGDGLFEAVLEAVAAH